MQNLLIRFILRYTHGKKEMALINIFYEVNYYFSVPYEKRVIINRHWFK